MSFEEYRRVEFQVNGRDSILICPNNPLPGNLWIWKTEFFEAFNFAERALLEQGYHLAYHRVSNMYGCPKSIEWMKEFYDIAVQEYGLSPKPALFGFSRGGLYACNFALKYPDCVGMLYLDAPVTDIRSWPGGKGNGPGEKSCWEECKKWYGINEETCRDFRGSPLDNSEVFARTGIPILLVCGAADRLVPYEENGKPFFERIKNADGRIARIIKPNCDHHPHSLYDPTPICNFVNAVYGRMNEDGLSPAEISFNDEETAIHGNPPRTE